MHSILLLIILAGFINAAFVIPTFYMKNLSYDKAWLCHSIIGLVIIPWLLLLIISPASINKYLLLQPHLLIFIVICGFIFGLGQFFLALAVALNGIALSFAINLGLATIIGSMFVVIHDSQLFTLHGCMIVLAILLIILSLIIYYHVGKKEQDNKSLLPQNKHDYHKGWLFATLTGLTSGLQNIAFVIAAFYYKTPFAANDSYWVWPPFLCAGGIALFGGFLYHIKKQEPYKNLNILPHLNFRTLSLITLMGLCFSGSIALYSIAMNHLSGSQQIIGWPAFMVSIILSSQLLGWIYHKHGSIEIKNIIYRIVSIGLLITAICLLAMTN